jgi:hypothetical protein
MTFIAWIEDLSSRFLTERSHELIVSPAIADLQHDASSATASPSVRGCAAVLVAFAGAAYEDLTADSSVLRIAGLALIPACYYTFLIYLCVPEAVDYVTARAGRLALPFGVAVLSLAPVLACCWPARTTRRRMQPDALRRRSGHAADA